MKKTTLIAGLGAAVTLVLASCGTTEAPVTAGTSSSVDSTTGTSSAGPITITDARDKQVTLDAPAVRVAATEWNAVEYLLALGVQPVGVADVAGYETWDSAEKLDGTETDIGTRGEPSLDTVATLDLDLVLVTDELVEGAMEQIEAEIPVIVMPGGDAADPIGAMWSNLDLVAEATGTQARAAELRTAFDATVAEGKAAVDAAGATGQLVAFSDAWDTGSAVSIRPYTAGSLVGAVLAEIGLPTAWQGIESDPAYGLGQADVEGLTNLPADTWFWYIANDESVDPYAVSLKDNAIWQSLPFVTGGQVHRFPDSIWMFGGPSSMTQLVDAAVAALN